MAEIKGLAEFININTIGNIRRIYNVNTHKMEDGKALRDKYRRCGFIATKYERTEAEWRERTKSTETSCEGTHDQVLCKMYEHDIQTLAERIAEDKQHLVETTEKERTKINREIKLLTHELECLKEWGARHGLESETKSNQKGNE